MRGVLLVPSSSPTLLPPIYDGLDVLVTSNITWFHLDHGMVSRRIYKLSFYGGHPITPSCGTGGGRLSLPHFSPDSLVSDAGVTPIQLETRFRGKVTWILCSVGGGALKGLIFCCWWRCCCTLQPAANKQLARPRNTFSPSREFFFLA